LAKGRCNAQDQRRAKIFGIEQCHRSRLLNVVVRHAIGNAF
jgi:hypothetical protein